MWIRGEETAHPHCTQSKPILSSTLVNFDFSRGTTHSPSTFLSRSPKPPQQLKMDSRKNPHLPLLNQTLHLLHPLAPLASDQHFAAYSASSSFTSSGVPHKPPYRSKGMFWGVSWDLRDAKASCLNRERRGSARDDGSIWRFGGSKQLHRP